jgi:hypothetical protein
LFVTLLDDVVLGVSLAISAGSAVVLFTFLIKYRTLTSDSTKSTQLAKNIWDAMNSRLSVMDTRIIDMMAKVEIYSAQSASRTPKQAASTQTRSVQPPSQSPPSVDLRVPSQTSQASQVQPSQILQVTSTSDHSRDVEGLILRSLADGPRTSNDIKQVIDKSREHTARLMKILFGKGLVVRNDRNKPYVYEITEAGRRYLEGN